MFYLEIMIKPISTEGLKALDEARRLGLDERNEFLPSFLGNADRLAISETFARDRKKYFKDKNEIVVRILSSFLQPGEVKIEDPGSNYQLMRLGDLLEWRLCEIWPPNLALGKFFTQNREKAIHTIE